MGLESPREARPAPLAVLGADPASPLFSKSPSNPDAPLRRADLHRPPGPRPSRVGPLLLALLPQNAGVEFE